MIWRVQMYGCLYTCMESSQNELKCALSQVCYTRRLWLYNEKSMRGYVLVCEALFQLIQVMFSTSVIHQLLQLK